MSKSSPLMRFNSRRTGQAFEVGLYAYWEANLESMHQDYTSKGMEAGDLLAQWASLREHPPSGLVSISWSVRGDTISEPMPFQFEDDPSVKGENFLSHFTWPTNVESGEPLNWLSLPVQDKLWDLKRADASGFIQEATGWKPSTLQPSVYLPALLKARRP